MTDFSEIVSFRLAHGVGLDHCLGEIVHDGLSDHLKGARTNPNKVVDGLLGGIVRG